MSTAEDGLVRELALVQKELASIAEQLQQRDGACKQLTHGIRSSNNEIARTHTLLTRAKAEASAAEVCVLT